MSDATPNRKGIIRSKTFWVQLLTVVAVLVPPVQEWLSSNPVEFVAALGALNVLVRFATRDEVSLFSPGGDSSGGMSGGASLLVVGCMAAGLMALPSCSLAEYPMTGSVSFRDEATGAKASLSIHSAPRARRVLPSK